MKNNNVNTNVADNVHCYKFTLQTMPEGGFENAMRVLVHDSWYVNTMQQRTKCMDAVSRTIPRSTQAKALVKKIEQIDSKIGERILHDLAFYQMRHNVAAGQDMITVEDFKAKFLKTEEDHKNYQDYKRYLDLAAFCFDIADGYITDAVSSIHKIKEDCNMLEYDGVKTAMKAFQSLSSQEMRNTHPALNDLFVEYSDSINEYMQKRFNTFNRKIQALQKELIEKGEIDAQTKEQIKKLY